MVNLILWQHRGMTSSVLTDDVRGALTAGRLAHLTTLNPDGSPQMSVVWVGLDGDDLVVGHLMGGRKVTNIARDPRVALTVEAAGANPVGMANYLIVYLPTPAKAMRS